MNSRSRSLIIGMASRDACFRLRLGAIKGRKNRTISTVTEEFRIRETRQIKLAGRVRQGLRLRGIGKARRFVPVKSVTRIRRGFSFFELGKHSATRMATTEFAFSCSRCYRDPVPAARPTLMDITNVTKEQAATINKALFPSANYLRRLLLRMEKLFLPDDPLFADPFQRRLLSRHTALPLPQHLPQMMLQVIDVIHEQLSKSHF